MLNIEVNTTLLKTSLKQVMNEDDSVSDLMQKISIKIGDNFLNKKLYVLVPRNNNSSPQKQYLPTISQYGGVTTAH